ncbi:MAG: mechanosensitive ion channel [Planctomycetota bacterium]|nr:mechanosensitive ion channel [Planctomycetota bacterium]
MPTPRPRKSALKVVLSCLATVVIFSRIIGPAFAAPSTSSGEQILHFLDGTIDWYHRMIAFSQTPVEAEQVIYRDVARRSALQVAQLGFDYARSHASALSTMAGATTQPANGRAATLAQSAAAAAQQVIQIQGQITAITQDITRAPPASQPSLLAQRNKLLAEIDLANSRRDALNKFVGFMTSSQTEGGGLLEQINDLQKTVPETQSIVQPASDATKTPAAETQSSSPAAAAPDTFRPESSGVLGLIEEMFTLTRQMSQLNQLSDQTQKLQEANQKLRDPIRAELVDAIHRGDALSATRPSDNPQSLASQRQELEMLAARFKLLADAAIPLGEQNLLLDAIHNNLLQWREAIERAYGTTLRYLLFRIIGIAVAILLLIGISEIWRRATFRYIHDIRRRRQFLLLRRIVVGCFITIIVISGVVTEIGSLATFAGLITAGIAVSLQTVILSGVAYFFLIGRYGVRVGDRVTISGITGDVIDVGLFRLYLMELGGTAPDLHRTGRIVVFSNSVLFGGSAFFKQLPGADYNWHQVAMTLSPDSDFRLAERLFLEAINSIFAKYKDDIERQHADVNNILHLQLPAPKPEGRLRFVDAGLEFLIRYPVQLHSGPETDDKITRALLETIAKEPKLKLVPTGTPSIQAAG